MFSTQASDLLRKMCTRNLVRKYCCRITAERKALVGMGGARAGGKVGEGPGLVVRAPGLVVPTWEPRGALGPCLVCVLRIKHT